MKLRKFLRPLLEDLEVDTDWQYRILRFLGSNRSMDRGHIEHNSKLCKPEKEILKNMNNKIQRARKVKKVQA